MWEHKTTGIFRKTRQLVIRHEPDRKVQDNDYIWITLEASEPKKEGEGGIVFTIKGIRRIGVAVSHGGRAGYYKIDDGFTIHLNDRYELKDMEGTLILDYVDHIDDSRESVPAGFELQELVPTEPEPAVWVGSHGPASPGRSPRPRPVPTRRDIITLEGTPVREGTEAGDLPVVQAKRVGEEPACLKNKSKKKKRKIKKTKKTRKKRKTLKRRRSNKKK